LHWYGKQKLTAKSIKPTQKNPNIGYSISQDRIKPFFITASGVVSGTTVRALVYTGPLRPRK